ncbi:hypothetical protein BD324DRAFT_648823 [Kockovaella imperatae]|uniref:Ser-Thr-rich glycosyl-phosphatidyl-inositol-anchored membrane family-domain-containing protein n=1 Tax=Kockovaella imperatae TaxID=4999 RepID=A0A1Y1UQF4_9TREE|nr:hypothetical protein BD324DRAFT_648823 [Kockovaella imperatae]ORX40229.1 hypothetical protein BD324DRAFT_648823 [Kockovaella imperatae]
MLTLFYLPLLLLAPLFTLADSQDPGQGHGKQYYPWNSVKWTMPLSSVKADTTVDLTWTGGSANGYEVYYVPQWEGQDVFESIDIATTSHKSVRWHTPHADQFPDGTTFILGVRDVIAGPKSTWYDLTGLVKFDRH